MSSVVAQLPSIATSTSSSSNALRQLLRVNQDEEAALAPVDGDLRQVEDSLLNVYGEGVCLAERAGAANEVSRCACPMSGEEHVILFDANEPREVLGRDFTVAVIKTMSGDFFLGLHHQRL